jgi:hypothetical protein
MERIFDQDLQQFAKFAKSNHLTLGVATRSWLNGTHNENGQKVMENSFEQRKIMSSQIT